jgi:EmrB/QacA subfamily drug resistance transporter
VTRRAVTPKVAVAIVYIAAMFMTIMDITIVNVALPSIGRDLHSAQLDQVSIAFLVSLAIFIPASGWIGDRFGTRRVFLIALGLFTGASVLCGVSTNFTELVGFRFLQGVGGGLLTPVGTAMLFRTFPPAERVKASAIIVIPTTVAPAAGPLLGGVLVLHASWHWVFLVNLPIGLAALLFGVVFLTEPGGERPGRFDLRGFLLSGSGLAALLYGISEGPVKGWSSAQVLAPVLAGLVLLAVMVPVELRTAKPLVSLRLFAEPLFGATSTILTAFAAVLFGSAFILSIYLQEGLHHNAEQTGLITFSQAIGVLVGAQVATRFIYPRVGPRRMTAGALTFYAVFVASLVFVEPGVSLWWLRLQLFAIGLCMGNLFIPLQAAAFAQISPQETGQASALFNTMRQLGGALGVALVYTIVSEIGLFTRTTHGPVVDIAAFRWAFVACALVIASVIPLALRIRDDLAAATIVRRPGKVEPAVPVAS